MSDAPRPSAGRSAGWHDGAPPGTGGPVGPSRGTRRVVAVLTLFAAAGAVAGVLLYIRPAQPVKVVTIPLCEYRDPAWSPNPWAEETRDALVAAVPDPDQPEDFYDYQELDRLRAKLLKTLAAVPARQPVVVYLTGLGAVHAGAVHVIPADAKPGDPTTWLSLDLVLDAVRDCPSDQKVVILDLAHPTADPFRGPLADTVSDRLHDQLQARADRGNLPFFVLTSCSKGELSLPMDEEQLSAFVFYVTEGLRGAADGFGPAGRADGRVRVREVADFAAARVARWARDCRGLRQTPRLYGDGSDFDLAARRLPEREAVAGRAYPDWLLNGWKKRDDWLGKDQAQRAAPAAVTALQTALARAERQWQAVSRAERVKRVEDDLDKAQRGAQADRAAAKLEPAPPFKSVSTWTVAPTPPAELPRLLEAFLAAQAVGTANPKDVENAKAARAAFLEKTKDRAADAAALVWRRAMGDAAPTQERLADLSALLDELAPSPTTEAQALRRLATWQRPGGTPWPPAAARQFLQTEDAASRALASAATAFPWAQALFAAAAKQREEGEQLLFTVRTRDEQAQAAETLAGAAAAFVKAGAQLDAVRTARRTAEDAAVVLAAAGPVVTEEGGSAWRTWLAAAQAAAELADKLERTPDGRDLPLGEWEIVTGRLAAGLQTLQSPYKPAAIKKRVDELAPGRVPEYQAVEELLRGPFLPGPERKRAWETARAIGVRVQELLQAADAAERESGRAPPPARPAPAPLEDELNRRDRRSQMSVELLRTAGLEKVGELDAARRAALSDTGPKWEDLANALRVAWTVRLPEQARAKCDKMEWAAADRRERYLPAGLAPTGRPPAAVAVHRREKTEYLAWVEAYYRGLGRLRRDVRSALDFYEGAAQETADVRRGSGD